MRTTIDLPDDLHRAARSLAHDRHQSLSATVAELLRRGLQSTSTSTSPDEIGLGSRGGFPTLSSPTGRVLTADDVRGLDDE